MKRLVAVFAAASLASPVSAGPTYLTCTLFETEKLIAGKSSEASKAPLVVELTLNEEQQTASYYLPRTGLTKRVSAAFQRDVITSKEINSGAIQMATTWSLNRVSGELTRRLVVAMGVSDITWKGECSKASAPERKF
jgi:hypothetical protein